ncbi:DEAD/DEAH box helicase [Neobacillus sp. SM06]|uniref:DEAD/DEAH box helicase n=1 Tax=Neobacillus sp. SM06 TaxID=3422492 RepID=UPI003D2BD6B9
MLTAQDENGYYLPAAQWKNLVFSQHEESYFGTVLEEKTENNLDGLALSGWQLVTLFAKESFNHFIQWDWSETAEICLAASHALYEGIVENNWYPDFAVWEQGHFRWRLPEQVKNEFSAEFWQQSLPSPSESVQPFLFNLYNRALDAYLTRNPAMKELFAPKLELLKKQTISGADLAHYFDEDSWLEWVGIKDSGAPFTIGLRLEEPIDGAGPWSLEVFLRSKKNPDATYGLDDRKQPASWRPHLEKADREQARWAKLIPWLRDDDATRQLADNSMDDAPDRLASHSTGGATKRLDSVSIDGAPERLASSSIDEAPGRLASSSIDGAPGRLASNSIGAAPDRIKSQLTEEEAWMFLTEASETLVALDIEILLPAWWQEMKNANLKVKAALKGTSSHRPSFVGLQAMLDFNWRFSMNGVDLSEEEFRGLVEEKRRLVYIRGRWVKLDPQFIRQIQELMKKAEKEGLHVRDLLEQELVEAAPTEEELENPKAFAKIQIELNRQWKQMIKQLSEIKEIPLQPVPAGLHGDLRPYQQLGMSWLWFLRQHGFGATLADDMGLGKTVQLISYLLMVKEQPAPDVFAEMNGGERPRRKPAKKRGKVSMAAAPDSAGGNIDLQETVASAEQAADGQHQAAKTPTKAALIICPTSVLGNWQKELERFAPGMDVYLHYGSNRLKGVSFAEKAQNADVVLTSYGLSHLDTEEFESMLWSTIAIDEAQNIKNPQTKQSRAVRRLRGGHHIALTGTPMENRLTELWSIFDFTNHGYLGSLGNFQKKFVIPIEKDENKDKVRQLQGLIRPFLLRRTKKDEEVALNLPDKQEQKEYCPLTAEQASLYEQLVQDTFAEIEKLTGIERKGLILQMLSRLKQLCNHPALYLKEKATQHLLDRSNKLEKLIELVEAVLDQGESCLIFTQYIEMGQMIKAILKKKFGIEVPFLNGSVAKTQRDVLIERFQNHEFPVFLLSLKAGGTGLNLTAANHVIHYDRWWNPAVENQATDRAYRIGQQRFVHVHKLICTGTLEEKIDAMLEKKQFLNDQIIQSENWLTELSTDDLKDLVLLGSS